MSKSITVIIHIYLKSCFNKKQGTYANKHLVLILEQ